jgi:hypothetical protein
VSEPEPKLDLMELHGILLNKHAKADFFSGAQVALSIDNKGGGLNRRSSHVVETLGVFAARAHPPAVHGAVLDV